MKTYRIEISEEQRALLVDVLELFKADDAPGYTDDEKRAVAEFQTHLEGLAEEEREFRVADAKVPP